jgi:anti-sigma factor ChrR (cupin superfamily)
LGLGPFTHHRAGRDISSHKHAGPEFIYVIEGEVVQPGERLGSGCAGIAPAGTEEDDFVSETGATFLIIYTE